MALSKIIAEGVDLTDDYAFTGTVTGAGEITASTTAPSEGGSATTNVVQGLAKSLLHFDAFGGTPSVADSFNVASIVDDGAGITQCNFTNNMGNDNFYFSGSISHGTAVATIYDTNPDTLTTSSVDIRSKYATSAGVGLSDYNGQVGIIHGDLA